MATEPVPTVNPSAPPVTDDRADNLQWDVHLPAAPPRRGGDVAVTLVPVGRAKPIPVRDPEEPAGGGP